MINKELRYKSKSGKRFIVTVSLNLGGLNERFSVAIFAYNIDDKESIELHFGISDTLKWIWHIDNILLKNFLFKKGLQLIEEKIDINNTEKQTILWTSEEGPKKFPHDIINNNDIQIVDSLKRFEKNNSIRKDILRYLYSKDNNLATIKEIIDYTWCYDELLIENTNFLLKGKLINGPELLKDMLEGESSNSLNLGYSLTLTGKQKYEEMAEKEIIVDDELVKNFKYWVSFASNKNIFIAHRFEEKELVGNIKQKIKEEGFDFKEGKVEDLGYITDDILKKIKESGFFLVLITPFKEYKDEKFSTSGWLLMEIGVAIAYGRKCLILADESVDQEEFTMKLQPDVQYEIFNKDNFLEKLNKAIKRIKLEYKK